MMGDRRMIGRRRSVSPSPLVRAAGSLLAAAAIAGCTATAPSSTVPPSSTAAIYDTAAPTDTPAETETAAPTDTPGETDTPEPSVSPLRTVAGQVLGWVAVPIPAGLVAGVDSTFQNALFGWSGGYLALHEDLLSGSILPWTSSDGRSWQLGHPLDMAGLGDGASVEEIVEGPAGLLALGRQFQRDRQLVDRDNSRDQRQTCPGSAGGAGSPSSSASSASSW